MWCMDRHQKTTDNSRSKYASISIHATLAHQHTLDPNSYSYLPDGRRVRLVSRILTRIPHLPRCCADSYGGPTVTTRTHLGQFCRCRKTRKVLRGVYAERTAIALCLDGAVHGLTGLGQYVENPKSEDEYTFIFYPKILKLHISRSSQVQRRKLYKRRKQRRALSCPYSQYNRLPPPKIRPRRW
jgi:hypothetical protein